jgi:hypothetical protein
VLKAASEITA